MDRITSGIPFIFVLGAAWLTFCGHQDLLFTSHLPATALLLTGYGAKLFLELRREKEAEELKRKELISVNIAILNLMRMANSLLVLKSQFIDPFRGGPVAFLEIPPALQAVGEGVRVNHDSLCFLQDNKEGNLLREVLNEEQRYATTIHSINECSTLFRREIQPQLERAGIGGGGRCSAEEAERALGSRMLNLMRQATEKVIAHVDQTTVSLQVVSNNLSEYLLSLDPDQCVIRYPLPGGPNPADEAEDHVRGVRLPFGVHAKRGL